MSTITPVLAATRTTGDAPLAVHFNAADTTSTVSGITDPAQGGTFRQIVHAFDFGDPSSGTHSISGMSKNSEPYGVGLAAHVYDTPGSYTATVTSFDGTNFGTATVTITVSDPSTRATYAISKAGNFTGAPAGSTHLTQSTLPTWASNTRYFFCRGEDWSTVDIALPDPLTNVCVAAYGSGAKPVFSSVGVGLTRPLTAAFPTDNRIIDIRAINGLSQENGSKTLFYRCDGTPPSIAGNSWTHNDQYANIPQSAFLNLHEIFYVDGSIMGTGVETNYTLAGGASRLCLINQHIGGTHDGNVRFGALERSVIRHCWLEAPYVSNQYHALKIHSGGDNDYADNWLTSGGQNPTTLAMTNWRTDKYVVANCKLGGGNNNTAQATWTTAPCPQNPEYGALEPIRNVCFENNSFVHIPSWSGGADIAWFGRVMISRGNVVIGGGSGALAITAGHAGATDYNGPYFQDAAVVVSGNAAPSVNAGIDQTISLPATASLVGTATDDGLPSATLTTTWSKVSGPGTVTFGNASTLSTTATFSVAGTYVLRLTADDTALTTTDDITITVGAQSTGSATHWRMKIL